MKWDDAKYLIAYIGPLSALISVLGNEIWTFSTVILTFMIIPVLEFLLPNTNHNLFPNRFAERKSMHFFDILLYLNLPLLYGLIGTYLWRITFTQITTYEWVGMTLGVGIMVGSSGINVAHELGHRSLKWEQWMSKWLLLPALYQHFFIEHNRGHHKQVATKEDPATSLYGEWLFAFWIRSTIGSYLHAWKLERDRLDKSQLPFYSFSNQMIRFSFYQCLYLVIIFILFGPFATLSAIFIAIIGFLLLESINYIEHYGLLRSKTSQGRYEKVGMQHSWNSNHEVGRIFLYELTRHADHHYKASKKYQTLEHYPDSPQLPMGYPAAILLALIPPVWFRVMNQRVPKAMLINNKNEK
jgi:alkane 1-monooxygenase